MLTGTWQADDGGLYYLRQNGNELWWAGFSTDTPEGAGDLYTGIAFTNVFHGTISGNTATGEWADVPRGQSLQNGTLTLSISNALIRRQTQTGGFGATQWTPIRPAPPPDDIFDIFNNVKKNQNAFDDHSLLDNLKPAKAKPVAIFGTITQTTDPAPMHVNYSASWGRSYNEFICLDNNDSPPDGDIDFDMLVDQQELEKQIGFWTEGWETSHNVTPYNFWGKLLVHNLLHLESIMYGGTTECGDSGPTAFLLPGWQQSGSQSLVFNGVPVAGHLDLGIGLNVSPVNAILGTPISFGSRVRITGNLVLDCGHGWTHPCNENDPSYQNQEIHPAYEIDIVQNFSLPRQTALLTGPWSSDDSGTYYLRQIGNTVWWLGMSVDGGRTFANVFLGTLQDGQITGNWADVPLGGTTKVGTLTLEEAGPGALSALSTTLARTAVTGGFSGDSWAKLYDVDSRTIIVVFDNATTSAAAWPTLPAAVPFEITIGNQRVQAQPSNARTVTLPNGQKGTQVDLNLRVTVDPPRLGALPVNVSFVNYRANWTMAPSDQVPGVHAQPMKAPRSLPLGALAVDPTTLTDRDEEAAKLAPQQTPPGGLVPDLTVNYHIEQAKP